MTLHIGFTGTRRGMTEAQRTAVDRMLAQAVAASCADLVVAHHGDCVGADAEFHAIAVSHGMRVIGHPPQDGGLRAFCEFSMEHAPLPYMHRNRQIVESAGVMIAAPYETVRQHGGGTWRTIEMARGHFVPVLLVWPNGVVVNA